MKKILLENKEVTIELEDGIVIAKWKSNLVDLNIAHQAVKYRLEATNKISSPLITDIKLIKKITKEARDFLASKEGCEGISVLAILIDSPVGSMIGNFWFSINKPLVQTKIFTDKEKAKKWLTQFVK